MPKPHLPSGPGPRQFREQVLERAALALRMRDFGQVEHFANEVLKSNRTDSAAIAMLARALIAQNRGGEAVAPLEKAARRNADPAIETLLGAALGGSGRRAEAIEQLRHTAARRPPFPAAFQELAGQLDLSGKLDDAIAVVEGGVALMPDLVDLQLDLARLYLRRNERSKARAILSRIREAAPGRPDIPKVLARALLLDGEYASAADVFRQALALHPDDVLTRADLAACLLEMGQREAGETSLRDAVRGRPQMFGRSVYALAMSSHGRFFFRPSAMAKFLQDQSG